jgi:hypothetical protein
VSALKTRLFPLIGCYERLSGSSALEAALLCWSFVD